MTHVLEIGLAQRAVALCDRGHRTLPESVYYTSEGPFGPRARSGIRYVNAPMFENAKDANGAMQHSSLRGNCSQGML